MKFLGIDFGEKRIGLAISDERGTIAFPKTTLLNDKNIFENISRILSEEEVSELVVGESVDSSGEPNKVSKKIKEFISNLEEKFGLPVHTQKEFFTSLEARKAKDSQKDMDFSQAHSKKKVERSGQVDKEAAALILQRYLDKRGK